MPVERPAIINTLKRIHLFRGIEDQKIENAADLLLASQVEVPAGATIYHEGDGPDYFYIIASGRVRISRTIPRESQLMQLGFLEEDDYFGEELLESNWLRQINAETVTDVTLLRLSVPDFGILLEQIPQLGQRLQFILDSYRLMLRTRFAWQDPEETIYFIARRHPFFLWLNILPPTIFGGIVLPLLVFLWLQAPTSMILLGLLVLFGLSTIVAWGWQYIDWTNDYYFVTNRRIVYQERVIFFYDSRQESPLEAVQSCQTNTSQWGRWLGYGNVAIRTYIGTILFRSVANPEQVMALIQDHQTRATFNQYRTELRNIKGLIDKRIRTGPKQPIPPGPSKPKPKPSAMRQFLSTMFHLRYEVGGTVIYRTHWFILLQKTFFPSLLLLGMLAMFIASASSRFALLSVQATCGLTFIFGLVVAGWWLYQYIDWHNDVYLITSDQIVDVNKKPLGQEQRQAAPLKNIIGIEYKRLGIIGLLLNYGTVFIRVGDRQLTFDDVFNPSEVQRELFHRLTAKNYAEKQSQAEGERQRLADWFASYNEWVRQNPELGQSPMPERNSPRTPPAPPRGGF
jgi:hypothetical protein